MYEIFLRRKAFFLFVGFYGIIIWVGYIGFYDLREITKSSIPANTKPINTKSINTKSISTKSISTKSINIKSIDREQGTRNAGNDFEKAIDIAPSLEGTDIPNGLIIDANGNFVVTPPLKQLFNYFYTLLGRREESDIVRLVNAYISQNLEEPAKSQALEIFKNYRLLEVELQSTMIDRGGSNDLDGLLGYMKERGELRRIYLGNETADVLFGKEQAYDDYTIGRLAIERNEELTEEEVADAMNVLLDTLPPSFKKSVIRRQNLLTIRDISQRAESSTTTVEQLFAERQALVGFESAQRLQTLDEERAKWKLRYQSYREEFETIKESNLSTADQNQSVTELKGRYFSDSEIIRVDSLDRIGLLERIAG